MGSFFDFFAAHRVGLAVFIATLASIILLLQWVVWMYRKGRFATAPTTERTFQLRFVIADFLVKIIDDFRHLLALVLLLIFAGTLAAVLNWGKDFAQVKEGLQVVMATLGGLVGSIIGYYFGESAVRKSAGSDPTPGQPAVPVPPPAGPPTPRVPAPDPPVPAPNPPV